MVEIRYISHLPHIRGPQPYSAPGERTGEGGLVARSPLRIAQDMVQMSCGTLDRDPADNYVELIPDSDGVLMPMSFELG